MFKYFKHSIHVILTHLAFEPSWLGFLIRLTAHDGNASLVAADLRYDARPQVLNCLKAVQGLFAGPNLPIVLLAFGTWMTYNFGTH